MVNIIQGIELLCSVFIIYIIFEKHLRSLFNKDGSQQTTKRLFILYERMGYL
jgi:hypothetical protein